MEISNHQLHSPLQSNGREIEEKSIAKCSQESPGESKFKFNIFLKKYLIDLKLFENELMNRTIIFFFTTVGESQRDSEVARKIQKQAKGGFNLRIPACSWVRAAPPGVEL